MRKREKEASVILGERRRFGEGVEDNASGALVITT